MAAAKKKPSAVAPVEIDRLALIRALEAKGKALDVPDYKLMKAIGIGSTMLSVLRHTKNQHSLKRRTFAKIVAFGIPAEQFVVQSSTLSPTKHDRTRHPPRPRPRHTQNGHAPASPDRATLEAIESDVAEGVAAAYLYGRTVEIISHHAESVGLPSATLAVRVGEMLRRSSRR